MGCLALVTWFNKTDEVLADINSVSVTPLVDSNGDPDRFDISGRPNEVKDLMISITNFGEPITLQIDPTNATTSADGNVDFDEKVVAGDYGLKYAFSDMTSSKKVFFKHNQTKDLTFKVKLPAEPIQGSLIGGFTIHDPSHPKDGHSGVGVYFDTVPTDSNHSIKLQGITPEVKQQQPFLTVDLANYQAKLLKNTTVQVKIKKNNWYNKLGIGNSVSIQDMNFSKIAPNSKIPIEFNQKQAAIQPGNYLVEAVMKSDHGTQHFKKNFRIESTTANMVNQQAKHVIYDKTSLYLVIIGILMAVIVLVFWGVAYQRR